MTKEEALAYRRECPYDAMGDYSVFFKEEKQEERNRKTKLFMLETSGKQVK